MQVGFLAGFAEAYTYPSDAFDAQYTAVLLLGSNDSSVRQQSQVCSNSTCPLRLSPSL